MAGTAPPAHESSPQCGRFPLPSGRNSSCAPFSSASVRHGNAPGQSSNAVINPASSRFHSDPRPSPLAATAGFSYRTVCARSEIWKFFPENRSSYRIFLSYLQHSLQTMPSACPVRTAEKVLQHSFPSHSAGTVIYILQAQGLAHPITPENAP